MGKRILFIAKWWSHAIAASLCLILALSGSMSYAAWSKLQVTSNSTDDKYPSIDVDGSGNTHPSRIGNNEIQF